MELSWTYCANIIFYLEFQDPIIFGDSGINIQLFHLLIQCKHWKTVPFQKTMPNSKRRHILFKLPPMVASPFSLNSPLTNRRAMLLFPTPDSPSKTSFICFDFPSGRALTTGGPEVRPFGRLFELMSMICKINLKKKKMEPTVIWNVRWTMQLL